MNKAKRHFLDVQYHQILRAKIEKKFLLILS